MGRFVTHPTLHYESGEEHAFLNLDSDKFSFFELVDIMKKEFKYKQRFRMWWKNPEVEDFEQGLRMVDDDSVTNEMLGVTLRTGEELDVYVEHEAEEINVVLEIGYGEEGNEEEGHEEEDGHEEDGYDGGHEHDGFEEGWNDGGGSDVDSVTEIVFNDSEEERDLGLDDGFDELLGQGVVGGENRSVRQDFEEFLSQSDVGGENSSAAREQTSIGPEAEGSGQGSKRGRLKLPLTKDL